MTQGKLSVTNKDNHGATAETMPPPPPSYEEANAGGSPCYHGEYSGDGEMLTEFSWDDKNIRRVFIRKVYAILMTQLLVTLAIVAIFTFCDPVKDFIHSNPGWYWASYVVFLATYLTLSCFSTPRRQFPLNLILLTVFTLSLSYMTGMLSSYYNTTSVVLCLGITVLVCLSVTVFSFQTKGVLSFGLICAFGNMYFKDQRKLQRIVKTASNIVGVDLTQFDITSKCQGVLFVLLMTTLTSGIVLSFVVTMAYVPWLHALYAALGAVLFTLFLAFDTQQLMGNKRYTLSPEEYIFATLNIYLDIVYIFTFILQLFGRDD